MKNITIGVLAHVDSGKTTLTEALMYLSANISKLGRVDHRDSFLDNFALERDRGITIFSKQAVMPYEDTVFTILDTPGHVDFSAETERTLQVLDYAILVISGTDSVQSHTATLWRLLRRYRVPCFIFVNKMDMQNSDRDRVFADIRSKLSERCADFGESGDTFFENIALCDEQLLESYTENESISDEEIIGAIKERRLFPVMFGSALRLNGVEEFLSTLNRYSEQPRYPDEFAAKVYKISEDNKSGRLTFMKITGGRLKVRDILSNDKIPMAKRSVRYVYIRARSSPPSIPPRAAPSAPLQGSAF